MSAPATSSDGPPLLLGLGLPALFFLAMGLYLVFGSWQEDDAGARARLRSAHLLAALPDVSHPVGARFDDALVLEGVDVRGAPTAGERVELTFYWRCLRRVAPNWKVFVHIEGRRRVNLDHHPVVGLMRFADLKPRDLLADPTTLVVPPGLGPGEVRVWVGLFDEERVMRRMRLSNPGAVDDDGHDRVLAATLRAR